MATELTSGSLQSEEINTSQLAKNVETSVKKAVLPPIGAQTLRNDYLPQNLLVTLTQATKKYDNLGPKQSGQRTVVKRADNLWNHEKSRLKFKHLTEQPPCYCGAGRDISYLLDATDKKEKLEETNIEQDVQDAKITANNKVPESIIPSEFHVVKHKGVVGLEVQDDKYTTKIDNHEDHLTVFPSMKPSGRQEALQLMKTMISLLKRAGVASDQTEEKESSQNEKDGNQIENLLNIVKNEQKIYNIVFNEIIRQVSIECVERGAVLAELRNRYATMLDQVPKQVMSLHEEVLAQRALDRRLTEELSRFKTSITLLTKELHEIHAHDEEVTRQAIETQAELNEALKESEKNASLLAEYHDLYELQRRRLDYQLSKLIEERDLWAGSAHMLSLKVTEKHNLVTVRRLHLFEKAWYKLANHFAVLLGQEDEKLLQTLAGHVHNWQDIAKSFNERLSNVEGETYAKMLSVQQTLLEWGEKFERVVTPDEGSVHPLESSNMQDLFDILKSWEEIFTSEAERFTGDILLSCEDDLLQLNTCVDLWIETAMKIFCNHPSQDGSWHAQHNAMMSLNKNVEELHKNFKLRVSGENGLARHFIHFVNHLDTWVNKINILLNGGETLFESEWVHLADFFQVQWKEALDRILHILSPDDVDETNVSKHHPEDRSSSANKQVVEEVYNATQSWLSDTINAFENENSNIIEQVTTTHSNMIRWMITILLRLAPDMKDVNCADELTKEDKTEGLGAAILSESTSEAIIERATMLFNWLRSLSDLIMSCCKDITSYGSKSKDSKNQQEGKGAGDLKKIEIECQGWMNTANLLIHELTGETIPMNDFQSRIKNMTTSSEKVEVYADVPTTQPAVMELTNDDADKIANVDGEQLEDASNNQSIDASAEDNAVTDGAVEMMVIGTDENVKKKTMEDVTSETTAMHKKPRNDVQSPSMSLESLNTLEKMQCQLLMTEERAQEAEHKAFTAESSLKEAEERIRALERSLSKYESNSDGNG